jgi:phosphocarrier protein HPr
MVWVMVQREVTLTVLMHARPAALLVVQATKSKSTVTILFNGKTINAKSMLNVLGGGLCKGARFIVAVSGIDEQQTLATVCRLIEDLHE